MNKVTQPMHVWDEAKGAIVHRSVTFVPSLYKIYDEILVNAADNKQRDPSMDAVKVDIDQEEGSISVWNNGERESEQGGEQAAVPMLHPP